MIKKLLMLLAFAIPLATPAAAGDLALGDSLALGLGRALGIATIARIGISSCSIVGMAPRGHYDRVVLSAGTNDPPGRCIEAIRQKLNSGRVEWVVPVNGARAHVIAVANAHGDTLLFYAAGRNWPHPRAYWNVMR